MKDFAPVAIIGIVVIAVLTLASMNGNFGGVQPTGIPTGVQTIKPVSTSQPVALSGDLKSFNSYTDVNAFLKAATAGSGSYGYGYMRGGMMETLAMPAMASQAGAEKSSDSSGNAGDYSGTNIQVAGVDESDIVKNDGKYIYTVTNGNIVIVDAYPASGAKVVSTINGSFTNILLRGDKLIAFGNEEFNWDPIMRPLEKQYAPQTTVSGSGSSSAGSTGSAGIASDRMAVPGYYPQPYYGSSASVRIYEVSDRANPVLLKRINSRGSYVESRLINNKVYAVFTEYAQYGIPMPIYAVNGDYRQVPASDIAYFDYPFDSYQFTTVLGVDLNDVDKEEQRKIVLMGGAQTIYVSPGNLYITYTSYRQYYPMWQAYDEIVKPIMTQEYKEKLAAIDASDTSDWRKDRLKVQVAQEYLQTLVNKDTGEVDKQYLDIYQKVSEREQELQKQNWQQGERTSIHKFSLGYSINYMGKGEVNGHALNQFSMDEFEGYFRIATTTQQQWFGGTRIMVGGEFAQPTTEPSKSSVYVLDSSLKLVGRLEDLAPGEQIFSARFMGKRAYLVTFRQLDPLFVIGLDNPASPQLLGKLKIPGYSDYLHPYDETHLIGIGKDAIPLKDSDSAFPLGVKLSLFDVSDVANPIEMSSLIIGDAGTQSYALQDHKAFLFSKERNLLVLPIQLAELDKKKYQAAEVHVYGQQTFQGAYVLSVSLEKGFEVRGRITHATPEEIAKMGDYYYGGGSEVTRSLYMDNTLYTISSKYVKANDLGTLQEQATVKLPYYYQDYPYPYPYIG